MSFSKPGPARYYTNLMSNQTKVTAQYNYLNDDMYLLQKTIDSLTDMMHELYSTSDAMKFEGVEFSSGVL